MGLGALWRVPLALLALALAGAFVLYGWLRTEAGNEFLRLALQREGTNALTEGTLALGGLRTDLATYARLTDLALVDGAGRPVVALAAVEVRWNLRALLSGTVEVTSLVLDRPLVTLHTDEHGTLDVVRVLGLDTPEDPDGSPWEGLPLPVVVGGARVVGGTLIAGDRADPLRVQGLDAELVGRGKGLSVWVDRLGVDATVAGPGLQAAPVHISLAGAADGGLLTVRELAVEAGPARLRGAGSLGLAEGVAGELGLTLDTLELDEVEAHTGDLGLRGEVGLHLRLSGGLPSLDLAGEVTGSAGTLALNGEAALLADPPTWSAAVDVRDLGLQGVLDAVTEPVDADGRLTLNGRGAEVEAALAFAPATLWGYSFDALTAELGWSGGAGHVRSLELALGDTRVGGVGRLGASGATLELVVDSDDLRDLATFGVSGFTGAARLEGPLTVDWSGAFTLDLDARVHGVDVSTAGVVVSEAQGRARVEVRGTDVTARGTLAASPVLAVGAEVHGATVGWAATVVGGFVSWEATVDTGEVTVPGSTPPLGAARVAGVAFGEVPSGGAADTAVNLTLEHVALGPLGSSAGQVAVAVRGNALQVFASLDDQRGERARVVLDADLSTGSYRVPTLELRPVDLPAWANRRPVSFRLAGDRVEDIALELVSEAGRVEVEGDVGASGAQDLRVRLVGIELDWLEQLGLPAMAGRVELDGRLAGRADAVEGSVQGRVTGLAVGADLRRLDVWLDLQAGDGSVSGTAVARTGEALVLAVRGRVPARLDLASPGLVAGAPVNVEALVGPIQRSELARALPATGELPLAALAGRLVLVGSLDHPELSAELGASVPMGEHGEVLEVTAHAAQVGERLELSAVGRHRGRDRLRVAGSAATLAGTWLSASVNGEPAPDPSLPQTWADALQVQVVPLDLPLELVASLAGGLDGLEGRLGGGVYITGRPASPGVVASLQVLDATVGGVAVEDAVVSLAPDGKGGTYAGLHAMVDGRPFSATVTLPFVTEDLARWDEVQQRPLEGQLQASGLPLQLVQGLDVGLADLAGTLDIEARLGGTVGAPQARGRLTVSDGAARVDAAGLRLSQVRLEASLEGDQVTVHDLVATTAPAWRSLERPGTLRGRGTARLGGAGLLAVDVTLEPDGLWVLATSDMDVAVSGELRVTGDSPALGVGGRLRVEEASVEVASDTFSSTSYTLDPGIELVRDDADAPPPPPQAVGSFLEDLLVEVEVDLNRRAFLEVEVPLDETYGDLYARLTTAALKSTLDGVVQVVMRRGETDVVGEVQVLRATTRVFGREFQVEEGSTLVFGGGGATNPNLRLAATYTTSQYGSIDVDIGGDALSPTLDFRSSEDYDQTDIASILVLGVPASELSSSEGGASGLLLGVVSGLMTSTVEQVAGGGFELIEIEAGEELPTFRVGKSIGRRLFLIGEWDPAADMEAGENEYQLTLEWLITRQLLGELTTGDQGASTVDLYYKFRF